MRNTRSPKLLQEQCRSQAATQQWQTGGGWVRAKKFGSGCSSCSTTTSCLMITMWTPLRAENLQDGDLKPSIEQISHVLRVRGKLNSLCGVLTRMEPTYVFNANEGRLCLIKTTIVICCSEQSGTGDTIPLITTWTFAFHTDETELAEKNRDNLKSKVFLIRWTWCAEE